MTAHFFSINPLFEEVKDSMKLIVKMKELEDAAKLTSGLDLLNKEISQNNKIASSSMFSPKNESTAKTDPENTNGFGNS